MTSGFFIRDNPFPSHHVSPFVKLERTASTPSGTPEKVSSAKLTQFRKRETTECYKFQKLPMFNAEAIGCFSCMPFRYTWAVWNTIATTGTGAASAFGPFTISFSKSNFTALSYAKVYYFSPLIQFRCNFIISSTSVPLYCYWSIPYLSVSMFPIQFTGNKSCPNSNGL